MPVNQQGGAFDPSRDVGLSGALTVAGQILSNVAATGGVGYGTGAGGAVTQITSKSTAVTLNALCGTITTHAANLANATAVGFTVNNAYVAANDVVVLSFKSGNTANSYTLTVDAVASGSFKISIYNFTGGTLGDTLVISFAVIKAVAA